MHIGLQLLNYCAVLGGRASIVIISGLTCCNPSLYLSGIPWNEILAQFNKYQAIFPLLSGNIFLHISV